MLELWWEWGGLVEGKEGEGEGGTDDDLEILPCLQMEVLIGGGEDGAIDSCQIKGRGILYRPPAVVRRDHPPGMNVCNERS